MAPTVVMGLVMEQMRKMESRCMGLAASRSAMPCALKKATWPWRRTSVTAPAIRLSSMLCWTADEMRSRRSDERPMDSGFAEGNSCAKAEVTDGKTANKQAAIMRYRMVVRCKRTSSENGASLQSGRSDVMKSCGLRENIAAEKIEVA